MAAAELAHAEDERRGERERDPRFSAAHDICRARRKRTSRVTPSLALSAACGAAYGAGVGRERCIKLPRPEPPPSHAREYTHTTWMRDAFPKTMERQ